jgi:tetratricopeptide (TPR) repeat protein
MSSTPSRPSSAASIWFGFAETRPTGRGTRRIHLRWGRIATLAIFLGVVGWLTMATALFFVYREQKGYREVAFGDVLLFPLKREDIRRAHGNYNVEQAKEALANGDAAAAFRLLRVGVSRANDNLEGRMLLIRFYESQGYHLGSRTLLETGVDFAGEDLDFYRLYGHFLMGQRDDEALLALAESVHDRVAPDSELARVMALFGMQAAGNLGRFEQARELFEQYGLKGNLEGVLTAAQLLDKRGQTEAAVSYLTEFTRLFGDQEIGAAYRALANYHIELGQHEAAINAALSYSLHRPLEFHPRVLLIRAYHAAGREELASREALTVLRQFRSDPEALSRLGLFAREAGDIDLARRLYELSLEGNIAVPRFGLFFLEAHLTAGRFQRTIDLCDQLEQEGPEWLQRFRAEFAVMRALAYLGVGNQQLGNLYLREFLSDTRAQNSVLFAVARTFEEIGLPEYALEVLEVAHSRDEGDEALLAHLVNLQVSLGESRELTNRVARLMTLRRTDYEVFRRVKGELNSDRFVFAENRLGIAQALETVLAEVAGDPLSFPSVAERLTAAAPAS